MVVDNPEIAGVRASRHFVGLFSYAVGCLGFNPAPIGAESPR